MAGRHRPDSVTTAGTSPAGGTVKRTEQVYAFIMRPSSLGGGRILRRTLSVRLSVCLSVCPSVRPSRYRYRASRRAT